MSDCIFCKLANGEIPTDMVYEDDKIACFRDASPQAPVHCLIVPKVHIRSLDQLQQEHFELMGHIMFKVPEIAAKEGLENGYRVVINTGEGRRTDRAAPARASARQALHAVATGLKHRNPDNSKGGVSRFRVHRPLIYWFFIHF